MNRNRKSYEGCNHINEPVQAFTLARRFLRIKNITILKLDNIAMLTTHPSFEYHEVWLS